MPETGNRSKATSKSTSTDRNKDSPTSVISTDRSLPSTFPVISTERVLRASGEICSTKVCFKKKAPAERRQSATVNEIPFSADCRHARDEISPLGPSGLGRNDM